MTYSHDREEGHPTVNATRARQGRWGKHIFWVLVFGTLLAALGMFAAWTWRDAAEGPPGPGMERADGKTTTDTPAPPPPNPQSP